MSDSTAARPESAGCWKTSLARASTSLNGDRPANAAEVAPAGKVWTVFENGSPNAKVDLLIVSEGYTEAELPKFTLKTLTYHEGIPGHHWQISIAQEAGSLPFIRSALLNFSGYAEGWGLYAEADHFPLSLRRLYETAQEEQAPSRTDGEGPGSRDSGGRGGLSKMTQPR
jgi:hypothetical protein